MIEIGIKECRLISIIDYDWIERDWEEEEQQEEEKKQDEEEEVGEENWYSAKEDDIISYYIISYYIISYYIIFMQAVLRWGLWSSYNLFALHIRLILGPYCWTIILPIISCTAVCLQHFTIHYNLKAKNSTVVCKRSRFYVGMFQDPGSSKQ